MLLLGIETATDVCSVALLDDDTVRAEASVSEPRRHASELAPLIGAVLAEIGAEPADLSAVAVSAGPGSYTGLRIGASTAKGLAFSTGAALVAVPSLQAMAAAARPRSGAVLALFPSRRGEVYAAGFSAEGTELRELLPPSALALDAITTWLPDERPLLLAGPAAEAVAETARTAECAPGLEVSPREPSGVAVAEIGRERFRAGFVENAAAWEPFYLKRFVAKPPRPIL